MTCRLVAVPPRQHHTRKVGSARRQQLAEVGVSGDQHAFGRACRLHDPLVGCAEEPEAANMDNFVAGVREQRRYRRIEALVDEELPAESRSGTRVLARRPRRTPSACSLPACAAA